MVEKATGLILLQHRVRTQGFNNSRRKISKSTLTASTRLKSQLFLLGTYFIFRIRWNFFFKLPKAGKLKSHFFTAQTHCGHNGPLLYTKIQR